MSDVIQSLYMLAKEEHPKDSPCPVCKARIKSVAIRKDKLLFSPCGCVFAIISEIKEQQNGNTRTATTK